MRKHSMTQSDVLRSRIEEQSQLICVLKQRNDQLLAKVNAAESQNERLIQAQSILKTQLIEDNKRFDRLEDHFNTLAANHQEMIKIKDDYKVSNDVLRRENTLLKEKLQAKDSEKVLALSREIRRLQEALKIETDLLTQQRDQNLANQQRLKSSEEEINKAKSQLGERNSRISRLQKENEALHDQNKSKDQTIQELKQDQSRLVAANMKRGEILAKLQSEKSELEAALEQAKQDIKKLKLQWKNELEKIDVNYKIRCLLEEIDSYKDTVTELEMHKSRLKNELSSEKLLNTRLRQYKN